MRGLQPRSARRPRRLRAPQYDLERPEDWDFALGGSVNDGTGASAYSVSSWTPVPGALAILFAGYNDAGGNAVPPSVSGNGLTWVTAANASVGTSNGASAHVAAVPEGGGTAGVTTMSFGGAQQNCQAVVIQVLSGHLLDPTDPMASIAQAITGATVTLGTSYALSFTDPVDAGSRTFMASFVSQNMQSNPKSGWTEDYDQFFHGTTNDRELHVQHSPGPDSDGSLSWAAGTSAVRVCLIELKAARR